jgi:DNA-directed RNA polymerase specialized sigma24 family protein
MTRRQPTEQRIWATANQTLTRKQLEAFTLRHRYQLTVTDIAAHLGISRQAVEARLQHANRRIAHHLHRKAAA